jgi:hypothetical protein
MRDLAAVLQTDLAQSTERLAGERDVLVGEDDRAPHAAIVPSPAIGAQVRSLPQACACFAAKEQELRAAQWTPSAVPVRISFATMREGSDATASAS